MKTRSFLTLLFLLLFAAACAAPGSPPEETPSPTDDTGGSGYTMDWLTGLSPDTILLQLDYEPTFFRMEASYPYGRVPTFTLYADGTLIFIDPGETYDQQQVLSVQISPEDALALVQEVMDTGFEGLEDHTDFCGTAVDGTETCIADAAFTILRATLADGSLKEVRSYAGFSNDPAAMEEIVLLLSGYSNPAAESYAPELAALFFRQLGADQTVNGSPWPLDPGLLYPTGENLGAMVLSGDDLARVIDAFGRNTGDFYVQVNDEWYSLYLVPWPKYADFSEDLANDFPAVTPAPVPEPFQMISDAAAANLAGVLGIKVEEVSVTSVERVDWPNGCLGIEYLDIACTEAIVPGYQVILAANGQQYEYRSNLDGSLLLAASDSDLPGIDPNK